MGGVVLKKGVCAGDNVVRAIIGYVVGAYEGAGQEEARQEFAGIHAFWSALM